MYLWNDAKLKNSQLLIIDCDIFYNHLNQSTNLQSTQINFARENKISNFSWFCSKFNFSK
jgi:hypothetical protein